MGRRRARRSTGRCSGLGTDSGTALQLQESVTADMRAIVSKCYILVAFVYNTLQTQVH